MSLSIANIVTSPGGSNNTFAPAQLTYFTRTAYPYLVIDVTVSDPSLGVAVIGGTTGNSRNLSLDAVQSVPVMLAALGLNCPVAGPTFTLQISSGMSHRMPIVT